jgi:Ca-activated chloride channel family protein
MSELVSASSTLSDLTFLSPVRLWLLLSVVALAAAYVVLQRRRRHRAVRYPNAELLRSIAPKRPGWRRHVAAAATGLSLAALVLGFARPAAAVQVPKEAATVMLVLDTSTSMSATDVSPSRIDVAVAAAQDFVGDLPDSVQVGLVTFNRSVQVVATPSDDHAAVLNALDRLTLGGGTASGDALAAALDAIQTAGDAVPDGSAAVVLLSDGAETVGAHLTDVAAKAADQGVPVSTIAFGTDAGSVIVKGEEIPVPSDPQTLAQVADVTGGKTFEAASADALRSVYEDIGTRVGYETQVHEVSAPVVGAGAALLGIGLGLSLLWNGRLT